MAGSIAIGSYLRLLRESKGISRRDMCARIREYTGSDADETTLWRLETGKAWTETPTVIAYMSVVGAKLHVVAQLLRTPNADSNTIRSLIISSSQERSNTPQELETLVSQYHALASRPGLLERGIGYLQSLIDSMK